MCRLLLKASSPRLLLRTTPQKMLVEEGLLEDFHQDRELIWEGIFTVTTSIWHANRRLRGGNLVLVNQSNGVQVGDTFVYNSANVTSPTSVKPNTSYKPKKIDAEEKCLEDLRSLSDRVATEEISTISTHIGVNWRVLGRRLKYTDGQLDQFYLNFEKLQMKEVVYQMLLDWKRTKTSKATIKSLAKHLYKANEVDAMLELHKMKFSDS